MQTKQIIIIRKFPNFHFGKMAAQIAHASMAFLTKNIKEFDNFISSNGEHVVVAENHFKEQDWKEIKEWLTNSFKKVVCYVETEEELEELYQKAEEKGLIVHKIVDNGATVFHKVPTLTAISIGPHIDSKFQGLTDHLPLLQ